MAFKINTQDKIFTFRDGQELTLKEPTLLQMKSAQNKSKDDIEIAKYLLVDMSDGDLDIDSINYLPVSEFKRLCGVISDFLAIDPKP
ncbi:hypothetical protein BKH46_08785 [Helicobacter sp. 12S02634-8]|uniref:phage tail assembly protein n=1 Tax=Helicobacter sp. 12S02634-8 TaxID=1476199 RepID=UPI000BA5492B|nr:phage tail assembly protein [Helicobacter sp. 12S02634-8]PAF46132.1 hypothetical protein BKH46_08785 [Helicobacter sp. 12S02634-8]